MKFNALKYLILVISVALIHSCATNIYYTTLDVMKPADVSFPLNVHNVVIVNNSVPQPATYGHSSTLMSGKTKAETLKFDSAAIFATSALRDALKNKGFFNQVDLSLTNQNIEGSFKFAEPLPQKMVKTLCRMFNAEAVISLNRIFINDNTAEYYFEDGTYYNELNAKIITDWSINYPDVTSQTLQYTDSFLWQSSDYDRASARQSLPKRYDALVDASILAGSNVGERIIPRWEKEDRYLFDNKNKLMRQAMDSVPYRKWEKAIALWEQASETTKSKKIIYQAYNNIAAAYEILGDINQAINYITKANNVYAQINLPTEKDGYYLITYTELLKRRKKELDVLKEQLGD